MYTHKHLFDIVAWRWRRAASVVSSPSQLQQLPEYQELIAMGKVLIPYILVELQQGGIEAWHLLLINITNENPVPQETTNDLEKVRQCWLDWGISRGYLNAVETSRTFYSDCT